MSLMVGSFVFIQITRTSVYSQTAKTLYGTLAVSYQATACTECVCVLLVEYSLDPD